MTNYSTRFLRLPCPSAAGAVITILLTAMTGCRKPDLPASANGQSSAADSVSSSSPADAKRRPETEDLARFLRGNLPPTGKLVELKSDPPVPLPNTPAGSNAWTYNVRVTIAPTEDILDEPEPKDVAAFQAVVAELDALSAWG